jgi:beta-mannosidase
MVSLLALGCAAPAPRPIAEPFPRERSLDGPWRFAPAGLRPANAYRPDAPDGDWEEIPVPANWFPARGEHAGAAWYRRDVPPVPLPPDAVARLIFSGVDYAADVWLNGQHLGFHEGRFAPFAFDVTDALRHEGRNLLAVRVDSPHEPVGRVWSRRKRLIKGIFSHHDTRPGGAWSPRGQDGNTGGIWGPVTLRISRTVAIADLRIRQRLRLSDRTAAPEVAVDLHRPPGRPPTSVRIVARLRPAGTPPPIATPPVAAETAARVGPGAATARLRFPRTPVRLWSTWDRGTPHRYRIEVAAYPADAPAGAPLDRAERVVGFRKLSMDPDTFTVRLNGQRLFLRGTNYISAQWVSEMTPADFDRDLTRMREAHINAVRVHAHVEPAAFYAACDRHGVLVWQDFPLQWGYADTPDLRAEAVRQAGELVAFLDHHPSLLAWCAHNEPPWEADWMQYKYPDYDPDQNRELDAAVTAALRKADPDRYVHPASLGEEHPWYGWYSGSWTDYRKPAGHPLITEFGAQALPDKAVLAGIVGEDALWPDTEAEWRRWKYHNFQRHETFTIAGVDRGSRPSELIRNTQTYQARLIKTAAESYRRQRFAPVAAIFQFLFSENWPSMNWGMMDYRRNPKPGYHALRTAYQPVLPCADMAPDTADGAGPPEADLWVVNDRAVAYPDARLTGRIVKAGATDAAMAETHRLDLRPDAGRKVATLRWPGLPPGAYELRLALRDGDGALLGRNRYAFRIPVGEEAP